MKLFLIQWTLIRKPTKWIYWRRYRTKLMSFADYSGDQNPFKRLDTFKHWYNYTKTDYVLKLELLAVSDIDHLTKEDLEKYGIQNIDINFDKLLNLLELPT